MIESKNGLTPSPSPEKYNFIMTTNIFSNSGDIKNILQSLVKDGFLLTLEDAKISLSEDNSDEFGYKLIAKFNTTLGICLLIRKVSLYCAVFLDSFILSNYRANSSNKEVGRSFLSTHITIT